MTRAPSDFDPAMADIRRLIVQTEKRIEEETNQELVVFYERLLDDLRAGLGRLRIKRDVARANGGGE